jgi:hypothetical protein
LLFLATLVGCGEGYEVVPARLNIVDISDETFAAVATSVHDVLTGQGFEDLGKYEDMIALIQGDNAMPEKAKRMELDRLEREYTYLNRRHHLRVVLSNYMDGVPPEISLKYRPPSDHFVELDVFDERPGGFGQYGLSFYDRLLSALKQKYGSAVRVVAAPPPTDDAEYRRITTKNTIASILGWCVALTVPLLISGSLSVFVLRRLKVSTFVRRLAFVLINTWLVAPLPFPAAFISVMPAPNLFAFPWTSMDYYSRVAGYAALSFPLTLVLCAVVSMYLFRPELKPSLLEASG